nr:MAG TPA: hypothetical protein [Caudoviricetes sp.]
MGNLYMLFLLRTSLMSTAMAMLTTTTLRM